MGQFSRVEQRIEQLLEGSFARLFAGRLHPREVATRLARAMEDNVQPGPEGSLVAPNSYTVHLNPDDHGALLGAHPDLPSLLAEAVVDLAHQSEIRLLALPTVEIEPDLSLTPRTVAVEAHHESQVRRATQLLRAVQAPQAAAHPRNPQLIVQGTRYVPLDRPVINIGRRRDNHIVIDDSRVSRTHAQLRLRFGRYVLYDLGSSSGTYVNDHLITEHILKPGDVISLAGVPLVYIEDETSTNLGKPPHSSTKTALQRPSELPKDAPPEMGGGDEEPAV